MFKIVAFIMFRVAATVPIRAVASILSASFGTAYVGFDFIYFTQIEAL